MFTWIRELALLSWMTTNTATKSMLLNNYSFLVFFFTWLVNFFWSPLYTGVVMQSFSIHKKWGEHTMIAFDILVSVSSLGTRGCIFGFNDSKYCPNISDQELSNMFLLILKLSIVFVRNVGVIYLLISTLPLKTTFGGLTKCSICFIAEPFSSHQKSVNCRIPTSTW